MTNKIYENVTNRIIKKIESGEMEKWLKSWNTKDCGEPSNPTTGTQYSGINYLLLSLSGYSNQNWMTYKQIEKLGGNVRKGEKSTMIIYYKQLNFKETNEKEEEITKKIPMLRGYLVFNAEQCENLPKKFFKTQQAQKKQISNLLEVAKNSGLKINIGGSKAFYQPASDFVQMPPVEAFKDTENFESVLLHELTHLTGHESRLNRLNKFARFGSQAYAFEELIAELGSAFGCAKLGIENPGLQHAEYLNSWLKVLKKDSKAIFKAASEAQKACDWLMEKLNTNKQTLLFKKAA